MNTVGTAATVSKAEYDNALDMIYRLAQDLGPLRRLVYAARHVAFVDQGPEAIRKLDEASEAFAWMRWEDDPNEEDDDVT